MQQGRDNENRSLNSAMLKAMGSRGRMSLVVMALLALILLYQNCGSFQTSELLLNPSGLDGGKLTGAGGETVSKVTPAAIYSGGGTIRIEGSNFSETTKVEIGGKPCANLKLVSSTEIECTAPPLSGGAKALDVAGLKLASALSYVEFSALETVAGRAGITGVADGIGSLARLNQIDYMVVDGEKLYFTESRDHVVRELDLKTFEVKTLAGGSRGFADGVGSAAMFDTPYGIVKKDGHLFVVDDNCVVRKIEISTKTVTTIAGDQADGCTSYVDGVGTAARFTFTKNLALHGDDLYISDKRAAADFRLSTIRKLDLKTLAVTTVAGHPTEAPDVIRGYWAADPSELVTERELVVESVHPYPASVDPTGDDAYTITPEITQLGAKAFRLHFAKFETDAKWDFLAIHDPADPEDPVLSLSGNLGENFWTQTIPIKDGLQIKFSAPSGSSLYGFKIDKIAYTMSAPQKLKHTTDGPASKARFGPVDAMFVLGDNLYFYDTYYKILRKLDLKTNEVTGFLGNGSSELAIGDYATTNFGDMTSITTDGTHLYISDLIFNRLVKVHVETRAITAVFSHNPANGAASNTDGALATASLMSPRGMAYDPARGLLFTVEGAIRRLK